MVFSAPPLTALLWNYPMDCQQDIVGLPISLHRKSLIRSHMSSLRGSGMGGSTSAPFSLFVPKGGLEPPPPHRGPDFESGASTSSATSATLGWTPFTNTADICIFCLTSIVRLFRPSYNDDTLISPPEKGEPSSISIYQLSNMSKNFLWNFRSVFGCKDTIFFSNINSLATFFYFFFVPQTGLEPVTHALEGRRSKSIELLGQFQIKYNKKS